MDIDLGPSQSFLYQIQKPLADAGGVALLSFARMIKNASPFPGKLVSVACQTYANPSPSLEKKKTKNQTLQFNAFESYRRYAKPRGSRIHDGRDTSRCQ